MKKIVFCAAVLAYVTLACNKHLDETAYSSIYTKDFYSNAAEAEAASTAVYGGLYDLYNGGGTVFAPEWSADQMFPRNVVARGSVTLFTYDPQYSAMNSFGRGHESPMTIWENSYRGIEKANWVLAKVPATPMDVDRRNAILGEAYFLRAFFHWMLAKNYGDVVIKIAPTNSIENSYVGKSTRKEVYQQIYKDLDQAIKLLPDYTPAMVKGRASKQAAELLHAKAALYDENWNVALEKARAVINSGKYSLMPSVKDLFDPAKEDIARQEVLFAVEMNMNLNPVRWSQVHYFAAPLGSSEYNKGGAGAMYAYMSFFNSFDPMDTRRSLLDTTYKTATGAVIPQARIDTRLATKDLVLMSKYKDVNSIGSYANNNIPILRLADAYLIAAEAEARLNGPAGTAYTHINTVRRRAGLPDLNAGLSREAFIDAVLQERSWEFFGEADRWYDLTRTNSFLTVIPRVVNADYPVRNPLPRHKYFPIPQVEINANPKLEQNPAWK